MPTDRLHTGNGVTIKEAVKAYKEGYQARGSKIKVLGATKTQIHYEIISIRGQKVPKTHALQHENFNSHANRKLRNKVEKGLFGSGLRGK